MRIILEKSKPLKMAMFALVVCALMVSTILVQAKRDRLLDSIDIGLGDGIPGTWSWGPVDPNVVIGGLYQQCRTVYHPSSGDTDPSAYLTLYPTGPGSVKYLSMRVLDGETWDAFNVYVKHPKTLEWILIYSYSTNGLPGNYWVIHNIDLSEIPHGIARYGVGLTIKIESTGILWPEINTYGLLAVDWVQLYGNAP